MVCSSVCTLFYFVMLKINNVVSEKADMAQKRRTAAEVALLALLNEEQAELFNEFVDVWTEYEDCLLEG